MKLNTGLVSQVLMVVILLIITFQALADTSDDLGSAADNITAASDVYPLTNFFKKKGVVLLAFIAGIVITIISAVMPKK
jgi:hypothetical protein